MKLLKVPTCRVGFPTSQSHRCARCAQVHAWALYSSSTLCNTGVAKKVQKYYEKFVNSANIKTVFNLKAGHTFVRSYDTFDFSTCVLCLK